MSTRVTHREPVHDADGEFLGEVGEHPDGTWWTRPRGWPYFTFTTSGTKDAAVAFVRHHAPRPSGYRPPPPPPPPPKHEEIPE